MTNLSIGIARHRRRWTGGLICATALLAAGTGGHAQVVTGNPAVLRATPAVEMERQVVGTHTLGLGSCDAARMLADDITRETTDFFATLKGAARLPLKAGKRSADEVQFASKLKVHDEHLRALERRLDFLKPCSQSPTTGTSRLKTTSSGREAAVGAAQATADKADEQKKTSQDHNKAIKDALRKMIEQIAEVNRATKL